MKAISKQDAFNALLTLRDVLTEHPQERIDADEIDGQMFLDYCQHLPLFMARDAAGIWEGHKNLHGAHLALCEPGDGAKWELIGYADTGWALPFTPREGHVCRGFAEFAETVLGFCARWEEHLALAGELNMLPDGSTAPGPSQDWPDMLTIRQAAEYSRVDERTIRDWLKRQDGDKFMLPGAIVSGRKVCIPRTDLDPWRKATKATRTPKPTPRKRPARKPVKPKS